MEGEFDSIDTNGGGQILFNEFIDWALSRDLDIEDDVEPEDWGIIIRGCSLSKLHFSIKVLKF